MGMELSLVYSATSNGLRRTQGDISRMTYDRNVFINCPFDDDYLPLLRPLLFTVQFIGFSPRIALEDVDSGTPRIQKIINLIEESRFAIHDLSRIRARAKGEYYRLNMPFELGVDVACRIFKQGRWSKKRCLILGSEKYKYQAAISDMSNSDISVHNNEPETIAREVRNWLNLQARLNAPGPSAVWGRFLDFMTDNHDALRNRGYSETEIEQLPVGELIGCIQEWTSRNH